MNRCAGPGTQPRYCEELVPSLPPRAQRRCEHCPVLGAEGPGVRGGGAERTQGPCLPPPVLPMRTPRFPEGKRCRNVASGWRAGGVGVHEMTGSSTADPNK